MKNKGQAVTEFIIPLAVLMILLFVAAVMCNMATQNSQVSSALTDLAALDTATGMKVTQSPHAKISHPEESAAINRCITQKGAYQTWKDKYEKNKFYLLCQIEDGRWGIEPVVLSAGSLIAKTAFVPRDGTMNAVMEYLRQSATRYLLPIQ